MDPPPGDLLADRRRARAEQLLGRALSGAGVAIDPGERNWVILGVLLARTNHWVRAPNNTMCFSLYLVRGRDETTTIF